MRSGWLAAILAMGFSCAAHADGAGLAIQQVPLDHRPVPGTAPGLKTVELSPQGRTFQLTFSKGDDVVAGLTDFAEKNHLTNAHFTAIGAFGSAMIGWADRPDKTFKYVRINEEMEVASFIGDITRGHDGKVIVHAHCVVGLLRNGAVYAGHCMEERVSLVLQMHLTDAPPLSQPDVSPPSKR